MENRLLLDRLTRMCLEPNTPLLNALSPSNYGSVRRKRSQCLPDPHDPSLNVETETGNPTPKSRARRLTGETSPTPVPSMGSGSICHHCWFPSRWMRELTCVPSRDGSPFLRVQREEWGAPSILQVDEGPGFARLFASLPPSFFQSLFTPFLPQNFPRPWAQMLEEQWAMRQTWLLPAGSFRSSRGNNKPTARSAGCVTEKKW